jgi:adenylate kinase family enzyme
VRAAAAHAFDDGFKGHVDFEHVVEFDAGSFHGVGLGDGAGETVKKRLQVYSDQTRPLVDYYSNWAQADASSAPKYRAISGTGSVEDITARAFAALAQ